MTTSARRTRRTARLFIYCLALAAPLGCDRSDSDGGDSRGASSGKVTKLSVPAFAEKFKALTPSGTSRNGAQGLFEITGVVDRVEVNFAGDPVVALRPTDDVEASEARTNGRVFVQAFTADKEPWARLARKQRVTVRGKLGTLPSVPNVEQAEVVDAGPPTVVDVAAATLSADRAAKGPDEFKHVYGGKDLIVTGTVATVEPSIVGGLRLTLEGGGPFPVRCDLSRLEKERLADARAPKPGQAIKAFGEIVPYNEPTDAVGLIACHLIATAEPPPPTTTTTPSR